MRILQLHCDYVEYTPVKKEIKSAEELDPQSKRFEEVVVAFVAVEESDNADVAKRAITEISESMKKIGCTKLLLYPYAHLSSKLASPTTALLLLKEMEKNALGLEVQEPHLDGQNHTNSKSKDIHLLKILKQLQQEKKKNHRQMH